MWNLKTCFFCIAISFFLLSCSERSRSVPPADFRTIFLNQPPEKTPCPDARGIDSLTDHFRRLGKAGAFSETLSDSFSVSYITGFRTPDIFRQDTLYPLVIYLHGGTGTTLNSKGEKAYEMLLPLADSMQLFLASPSASRNSPWWSPSGLFRILQTLRLMTLYYPIDPDKVFLVGVSDGAAGCWAAANAISSPFAGFIAVSGYGGIVQSAGMQLFPQNIMQRPFYNVNAGKDHLYPIATVNRFLDYMEQNGVNLIRKEYPEEKHGFDYRMQEMGTICQMLRTWSRPESRSFSWHFIPGYPNLPDNVISWEPVNEKANSHISGFQRADTFFINSGNIQSVVLRGPSLKRAVIKNGDRPARQMEQIKPDRRLLIQSIRSSCFPVLDTDNLFKLNL